MWLARAARRGGRDCGGTKKEWTCAFEQTKGKGVDAIHTVNCRALYCGRESSKRGREDEQKQEAVLGGPLQTHRWARRNMVWVMSKVAYISPGFSSGGWWKVRACVGLEREHAGQQRAQSMGRLMKRARARVISRLAQDSAQGQTNRKGAEFRVPCSRSRLIDSRKCPNGKIAGSGLWFG
jgi:hypothetical protein